MSLGDPFAAFLASRPAGGHGATAQSTWQLGTAADATQGHWGEAGAAQDPFATFAALRPPAPERPQKAEPTVERGLREELMRAKRELLEVGLKAELMALEPSCPPHTAARLRRLRKAQSYLRRPEHTAEVMSSAASNASDTELTAATPGSHPEDSPPGPAAEGPAAPEGAQADSLAAATPASSQLRSRPASPGVTALSASRSMPSLSTTRGLNATLLPPIGTAGQTAAAASRSSLRDDPTLLRGWWTKTRCWNVIFSDGDLRATRQNLATSGGSVALGGGRLPLFAGSHLLYQGLYYAFRVDALDDENFPLEGLRGLSFGFGISRLPADHRDCESPVFAYEIPSAVVVGFGGNFVDGGVWRRTGWDPRDLQQGDIVGLFIPPDGDIVVFVNDMQVLRVKTSLGRAQVGQRQPLYPVVDLHGRVAAVTLLLGKAPPNKPLLARSKLR